jgi:hypothetical protein
VLIERAGGLGAKVTVLEVEVERADAVRAADAGELHASLDPLGGVVSHGFDCSLWRRGSGEHCGRVAKVMGQLLVTAILRQLRSCHRRISVFAFTEANRYRTCFRAATASVHE